MPVNAALMKSVSWSVSFMGLLFDVRAEKAWKTLASLPGLVFWRRLLLLNVLLGRGGLEELRRFAVGGRDSKGLLQELARLQAVAAAEASGLDGGLAFWRNSDFDDTRHQVPSGVAVVVRSGETQRCWRTAGCRKGG